MGVSFEERLDRVVTYASHLSKQMDVTDEIDHNLASTINYLRKKKELRYMYKDNIFQYRYATAVVKYVRQYLAIDMFLTLANYTKSVFLAMTIYRCSLIG